MLRHRAARASDVDTRLLLSARTQRDVLYREELDGLANARGLAIHRTLTRERWDGWDRRVDRAMLEEVGPPPAERPRVFVCGPTGFVESVADSLVELGHDPGSIHAERFGPTG
jgi:ferredoxin-NADP reductase